ncbi:MAG: hypothetical protein ACTSXL_03810 [Alphaproteobacteria bacterium]|nr:MAG: hypothetical protein B6I23_02260 [Rickettsiaceae bacterium 4572_127]
MNKDYLEQLERINRYFLRLQKAYTNQEEALINREDDILAFFVNCWHLYDWLIESENISRDDLEKEIKESKNLQFCRKLTNTYKHYKRKKTKAGCKVKGKHIVININEGSKGTKVTDHFKDFILCENSDGCFLGGDFEILTNCIDAKKLAQNCLNEWDIILQKNKLIQIKKEG